MRTSCRGDLRGFSLFELLIVLVLMGVVAGVIFPTFSGSLENLEMETSCRDLVTRMKKARSSAIGRQSVFRIILQKEDSGILKYHYADEYGQSLEEFSLPEGVEVADGSRELPLRISFYPNGRSSGAEFTLRNQRGKLLQIKVDPITGFGKVIRPAENGLQ